MAALVIDVFPVPCNCCCNRGSSSPKFRLVFLKNGLVNAMESQNDRRQKGTSADLLHILGIDRVTVV